MTDHMRAADLHYAYQCGEAVARGDTDAEAEAREKFANDAEAQAEYQRGIDEQSARQVSMSSSSHSGS